MAVRHELKIEITPDGEITIKVEGATGAECLDLTREIEEALGLVVDRQKTSAYYQDEVTAEETVKIGED